MHLQYKHSGPFANHKHEELSYAKNQKMCNPILVTLLKKRPYYSQSSHKNATPSSGTSPLASYKDVPPPPPPQHLCISCLKTASGKIIDAIEQAIIYLIGGNQQ